MEAMRVPTPIIGPREACATVQSRPADFVRDDKGTMMACSFISRKLDQQASST